MGLSLPPIHPKFDPLSHFNPLRTARRLANKFIIRIINVKILKPTPAIPDLKPIITDLKPTISSGLSKTAITGYAAAALATAVFIYIIAKRYWSSSPPPSGGGTNDIPPPPDSKPESRPAPPSPSPDPALPARPAPPSLKPRPPAIPIDPAAGVFPSFAPGAPTHLEEAGLLQSTCDVREVPSSPPALQALPLQDSSNDSPPRGSPRSTSPSSVRSNSPPGASSSPLQWIAHGLNKVYNAFVSYRNPSKYQKYRHAVSQMVQHYKKLPTPEPIPFDGLPPAESDVAKAWNEFIHTLTVSIKFENADAQYKATVELLRNMALLLYSVEEPIRVKFAAHLHVIKELCYQRFTGIHLFSYCRALIELHSGPLPEVLSLGNFGAEFLRRTDELDHLPPEHSTPATHLALQKLKGAANIAFDPLAESNLPYVDGDLRWNERKIRILRHGVPVYHNNPQGFVAGFISNALRRMVSSPPTINFDYEAFILRAAEKGENILQIILEDGEEKTIGDESPRVETRLAWKRFRNFFPCAWRLDGRFFTTLVLQSVDTLIGKLKNEMFGEFKDTGFCIPEEVRSASHLADHIDGLLEEVKLLYFPKNEITNLAEHQTFIIFSYVHIALFLCTSLNISIFEAFCKDDIDRGNAFKTIFKLVYLYLTGQITSDNLKKILVNTLAAPVIVKKQGVIPSRKVFIGNAIPILIAAFERCPLPNTRVLSGVKAAAYDVFEVENQSIYPYGPAAGTLEEYQELFSFDTKEKPLELREIQQSFSLDEQIGKLQAQVGPISDILMRELKPIFDNDMLKATLSLDEEKMKAPEAGFHTSAGKCKYDIFFKISRNDVPRIKATVTIDPKTAQATYQLSALT